MTRRELFLLLGVAMCVALVIFGAVGLLSPSAPSLPKVPPQIIIHQGDWITCDKTNAKVARASHDILANDVMSTDAFYDWQFHLAKSGLVGVCPDGSDYIKTGVFAVEVDGKRSIQSRLVMHFADGWH